MQAKSGGCSFSDAVTYVTAKAYMEQAVVHAPLQRVMAVA